MTALLVNTTDFMIMTTRGLLRLRGRYRREIRCSAKPREEWIAVPVSDSRIPCEIVNAARERIKEDQTFVLCVSV